VALNIGNLNFGVDANTTGLQKAIQQLDQFRKKTDQVAKSQSSGSKQAATAMARQESAIKKAFQQTLRLQQAQRKAGAAPEAIGRTSTAFRTLTKELTSGKLSTIEFTRAVDAFNARLGRTSRALRQVGSDKAAQKMNKLGQAVRQLESASVLAIGPLSGLGARIRAIGAITTRSSLIMAAFIGAVAGTIVVIGKLITTSIMASKVFEQANARFVAATGSISQARTEMSFVIKTARDLGLRIDTSAKAFSRLTAATKGSELAGEQVRKIFTAVSQAAAALRLESGEVEGTFRAIEQIMSKGSVQAEELRGQLGERLPGAFRLAAEAMGVTTQALGQMLKSGEVLADDFLPKFTEALSKSFSEASKSNVNSFTGSMNNLANAGLLFANEFNKVAGVSKIVVGLIKALTSVVDFMTRNLKNFVALLGAASAAMLVLWGPAALKSVVAIASAIRGAAVAMFAFNIAIAANPLGALASIIVRAVAALAAATAAFFGLKLLMDDTTTSIDDVTKSMDEMAAAALTDTGTLTSSFKSVSSAIEDLQKETRIYQEVLGFIGRINSPELLKSRFEALAKVTGLGNKELAELAAQLTTVLGQDIASDFDSVAEALFRATTQLGNLNSSYDKIIARNNATKAATAGLSEEFQQLQARIDALRQGSGAAEVFDTVTSKANALRLTLEDTNLTLKQREALVSELTRLLKIQSTLETSLATAAQNRVQAQRDADKLARDQQRQQDRILKTTLAIENQTERLQERLAALSKGPRSFEVFTRIQEPLDRLREKLVVQGFALGEINRLLAERRQILEELFIAEERLSNAGKQAADAIGNSLEAVILKTEKASDALKNLARELFRVLLRATLIDPFIKGLTSALTGGFSSLGVTGGVPTVPARHGGTFKVGGTGGPDSQRVNFAVTPGEEILVRRPDQRGGAGGGGNTFIINAPGADAGTIERIREVIRTEFVPQILAASTKRTVDALQRPRFA